MKGSFRRAVCCALIVIFFFPYVRIAAAGSARIDRYLIVGTDAAASNTDVIAVISYSHADRAVSVLQIPRDTYYCFGGGQNKLNQLYPHALHGKDTRAQKELALRELSSAVSQLLGVKISTYIAVSICDFARMVDRIGGVPISLPTEISYFDDSRGKTVVLPRGNQTLFGDAAAAFVRYRSGYPTGDLGRIDAQKLFISALFAKLASGLTPRTLTSVFGSVRESLVTNLSLTDGIGCGMRFMRHYGETPIHYLTLPGAPALSNGISYYSVCRASAREAVEKHLLFGKGSAEIDASELALAADMPTLAEIYLRKSVGYRVYTDAELRQ